MKAFISVDLEGMSYIFIPGHLNLKGPLYEEARRIACASMADAYKTLESLALASSSMQALMESMR